MDLSNGERALRSLKHRPKVSQQSIETATSLWSLLDPSKDNEQSTNVTFISNKQDEFLKYFNILRLDGKDRWEPLAVYCVVLHDLLQDQIKCPTINQKNFTSTIQIPQNTLESLAESIVREYLEHYEPRVRLAIASMLEPLATLNLSFVSTNCLPLLIDSVLCHLSRSPDFEETGFEEFDDNISMNGMETPPTSPSANTPRTPSTPHRLDDVTGWKSLESSLCGLKYIIRGAGVHFLAKNTKPDSNEPHLYLSKEMFDLVTMKSVFHVNRHVRVVGLDTITVLCEIAPISFLQKYEEDITQVLLKCIARGMQDNWSQVRYAASTAVRSFLVKLQENENEMKKYLPVIVPRLCLNRYYVAERVQKHSQETWRLIFGETGRTIVATYASEVVEYYIEMTNHCVREAACHCIAELATKVDHEAISPYVPDLLAALLLCFHDNAWLVRDAACIASAHFVASFPELSKSKLPDFYDLWIEHLSDEIWSVREDAAVALGVVMASPISDDELKSKIIQTTKEYLKKAKTQPAMSQSEFEALKADEKKHHNKQAYSCCALEPKFLERKHHRHAEPWEHTDGAIYLVRELCGILPPESNTETINEFMSLVADVAILRHFPQTSVLQETIWKQLPIIAHKLGKRQFKKYLEYFLDPLVLTIESLGANRLAKFAAKDCVHQLSTFIGPMIFQGRLQANDTWNQVLGPIATPHGPPYSNILNHQM